jgi:hypothetical protein
MSQRDYEKEKTTPPLTGCREFINVDRPFALAAGCGKASVAATCAP